MTGDIAEAVEAALKGASDNFDNLVANPLTDLITIPGHQDYTPERRRVSRNGSRVFLQYGSDSRFSETDAGLELQPDAGDTLTINTTERVSYPVGYDIIASLAYQLNQAPQSGDVVAGGYGDPDVGNFDPSTHTYSGSSADGYFWYHTSQTGLTEIFLAEVRDGTIIDSVTVALNTNADVWTRMEQMLNWYDVGPCVFTETYTNVSEGRSDPQQNDQLSSVAKDDGKGPLNGSKRIRVQIHQDASNSGLVVEAGSMAVQVPGRFDFIYKTKDHTMDLDASNTTDETYEVVGAIRGDPSRPLVSARINNIEVSNTPSDTAGAEVLVQAIDPSSTNYGDVDFETPAEHSSANSIIEDVVGNTDGGNSPTGPDADAAGTDSTGAATANTMTNPGGYQVGRTKVNQQKKTSTSESGKEKDRVLTDTDVALVLIDATETGVYELEVTTRQNA